MGPAPASRSPCAAASGAREALGAASRPRQSATRRRSAFRDRLSSASPATDGKFGVIESPCGATRGVAPHEVDHGTRPQGGTQPPVGQCRNRGSCGAGGAWASTRGAVNANAHSRDCMCERRPGGGADARRDSVTSLASRTDRGWPATPALPRSPASPAAASGGRPGAAAAITGSRTRCTSPLSPRCAIPSRERTPTGNGPRERNTPQPSSASRFAAATSS